MPQSLGRSVTSGEACFPHDLAHSAIGSHPGDWPEFVTRQDATADPSLQAFKEIHRQRNGAKDTFLAFLQAQDDDLLRFEVDAVDTKRQGL